MQEKKLELLSPAKDLECGIAAINCGADAVYIGSPKFGARAAAGNSLSDIVKLVEYAHKFWVKVYVTVNTIINDDELEQVRSLITKLYDIGVDAIIFQDMAILKMDIPTIPLFASTQTHNYEIERISLLDEIGIKRIILARELSLDQIREIFKSVNTELEFFIHGALCVCLSGQCYMSHAMLGRSANRGECAQPCRLKYSLIDNNGKVIVRDKHLLSLHDLNLSAYLNDLIEAGITSFKIEGRLKDVGYVKNITAYYRQKLDEIIGNNSLLSRSSSGHSIIPFEPDPDRTFNRGYTSYFIDGKGKELTSIDSPKSIGKFIGKVTHVNKQGFTIDTIEKIVNGDGICFFDDSRDLIGMNVGNVDNNIIITRETKGLIIGTKIYRNHDHAFNKELEKECFRKIRTKITVDEIEDGLRITARDESGVAVTLTHKLKKTVADNSEQALDVFKKQFSKSGSTIFDITDLQLNFSAPLFFPIKTINELRRSVLETLAKKRTFKHRIESGENRIKNKKKVGVKLDYRTNVVNKLSESFYKELGAGQIEKGFELQNNYTDKILMTCKYCIKDELGYCPLKTEKKLSEPLYLINNNKRYKLIFNCKECQMEIVHE